MFYGWTPPNFPWLLRSPSTPRVLTNRAFHFDHPDGSKICWWRPPGWWLSLPPWKMMEWKSDWIIIPTLGEHIKFMFPNHHLQLVNISISSLVIISPFLDSVMLKPTNSDHCWLHPRNWNSHGTQKSHLGHISSSTSTWITVTTWLIDPVSLSLPFPEFIPWSLTGHQPWV